MAVGVVAALSDAVTAVAAAQRRATQWNSERRASIDVNGVGAAYVGGSAPGAAAAAAADDGSSGYVALADQGHNAGGSAQGVLYVSPDPLPTTEVSTYITQAASRHANVEMYAVNPACDDPRSAYLKIGATPNSAGFVSQMQDGDDDEEEEEVGMGFGDAE